MCFLLGCSGLGFFQVVAVDVVSLLVSCSCCYICRGFLDVFSFRLFCFFFQLWLLMLYLF